MSSAEYKRSHYKQFLVLYPLDQYPDLEEAAKAAQESVGEYVRKAVRSRIDSEKKVSTGTKDLGFEISSDRRISLRVVESPDLPSDIGGVSAPKNPRDEESDDYFVLLNDSADETEKAKTFVHEMLHIWHRDHFKKGLDVERLEAVRHAESENYSKTI